MNEKIVMYKEKAEDMGRKALHNGIAFASDKGSELKCSASFFCDDAVRRVKKFNTQDSLISVFSVFSLGAYVGTLFSRKLRKIAPLLGIITVVSTVYVLIKMYFSGEEQN